MKTLGMTEHWWIPCRYETEIGGVSQVRSQSGLHDILDSGVGCTKTLRPALATWLKLRGKKIKTQDKNLQLYCVIDRGCLYVTCPSCFLAPGSTQCHQLSFQLFRGRQSLGSMNPLIPLLVPSHLYPLHLHSDSLKPASFCFRLFIYLS